MRVHLLIGLVVDLHVPSNLPCLCSLPVCIPNSPTGTSISQLTYKPIKAARGPGQQWAPRAANVLQLLVVPRYGWGKKGGMVTMMAMTYIIQLAWLQLQVSYKTVSILKEIILKYFLLRSYLQVWKVKKYISLSLSILRRQRLTFCVPGAKECLKKRRTNNTRSYHRWKC